MEQATVCLQGLLHFGPKEHIVTRRARDKRIYRLGLVNEAAREAVSHFSYLCPHLHYSSDNLTDP